MCCSLFFFICGIFAILKVLNSNIVFFLSPSEIYAKKGSLGSDVIRIGGLVKKESLRDIDPMGVEFVLTDLQHSIKVQYNGFVPMLLKEGQGAIAKGSMHEDIFIATEILAKHDERYMPPEIADSLKNSDRIELQ